MALKDSGFDKLSSSCLGSLKLVSSWSPGRAARSLICLSQELLLVATWLTCLSRNSTVASFNFWLSTFLSSLYRVELPCFVYSLFFLLAACLTAAEQIFPSRLDILTVFVGQWVLRLKSSKRLNLSTMSLGSDPLKTCSQDSFCTQLAKLEIAEFGRGLTILVTNCLWAGLYACVLGLAKTIRWSEGFARAWLSGRTGGLIDGSR